MMSQVQHIYTPMSVIDAIGDIMPKVVPTSSGFAGNARNILYKLEHLFNNGQWQEYNRKLDSLAKQYPDNQEVQEMIKKLKINNPKEYRARRDNA